MEEILILIFVSFFATNPLDKAESVKVKLEETPLKTFDEIFGEGWWDKGETEDLKTPPTNFGQNVHHQIDRQNTQIGQIEPYSTDQNLPLTESDQSDNAKNCEEQNELMQEITSNEKRKIIDEFLAIKAEIKQRRTFSAKKWVQIDQKIAKHLKVNRKKIYKWKKELGISRKLLYEKEERKHLIEKFDQRKAELKRAGLKNSYNHEIDETVAKELGLTFVTIYNWKRKLGQPKPNKYPHSDQKELMKRYYEIKDQNRKIRDEDIAKSMKIGTRTLYRWKKQFKRQQFHPNSGDGNSVEENGGSNV